MTRWFPYVTAALTLGLAIAADLLWGQVSVAIGVFIAGGIITLLLYLLSRFLSPRTRITGSTDSHSYSDSSAQSYTDGGSASPKKPMVDSAGDESEDLANLMLRQGRYTLLLRPQIADNIPPEQVEQARQALDEEMTLVPAGELTLSRNRVGLEDQREHDVEGSVVHIEGIYLDRHQVTNWQYARFVEAGGYEQMQLWDPEIVPAVLDFVDETGEPGPAFWRGGTYRPGTEKMPVVGVCWYEAAAYARWVGKRLPTDPEWVKAGSWPVPLPGSAPVQRKYPWGNGFDQGRANLWGSGPNEPVNVDKFAEGASVGGAFQLIGNVWEWTSSRYGAWSSATQGIVLDTSLRSLRGGAFDTYFDQQARCDFQSGDQTIARKHNIGFRCAIGLCDLIPDEELMDMPAETEESLVAATADYQETP
ncbi:MAG: formylglycine-generating enzyme family protein [Pirellulaceae bacterium]